MFLDSDEKRVLIPVENEDGSETVYELDDLVEVLDDTFGIFLPTKGAEGGAVVLRLVGDDEEKAESYESVEDESLEQTAFDLYRAKCLTLDDTDEGLWDLIV